MIDSSKFSIYSFLPFDLNVANIKFGFSYAFLTNLRLIELRSLSVGFKLMITLFLGHIFFYK